MPGATMPSSPPARADAPPRSPGSESQYTLDLAALDMQSRSGASTPLPQRQVERVFSEDIDGPTDFTLNLTQWMKGGKPNERVLDRLREEMPAVEEVPQPSRDAGPPETTDEHHDSSDWDPYEQSATPQPPPHKQFLQPTVEEYNSELTPARFASAHSQLRGEAPEAQSSPTRNGTDQSSAELHDLRLRFREMEAECKELERRNTQLEHSLIDQQRNHELDLAARDSKLAEVIRRERDLLDAKDVALSKEDAGQIAELKQQLERERNRYAETTNDMQTALEEARRNQQSAEKMAESQGEAFDAHRGLHEAELARIQGDSKNEIADLKEQLRAAEERSSGVQTDQSRLVRMEADYRRALELAQGLQRKLKELQQQMRAEQGRHQKEIEELRTATRASEEHVEAKQSLLNDATLDRDALQDRLDALIAEMAALRNGTQSVDELKRQMAESETVNAIFDSKMSDRMRRREAHWRHQLDRSEQERQLMAKALLHQWGREELGVRLPQLYRYKYAQSVVES